MIISNQQLRQLEGIHAANFPGYMLMHLQECFPASSQCMGEEGLLAMVALGSKQAAEHGFTTRYEVCLYIDVMMMLGAKFDTDIQLPSVRQVLRTAMAMDPTKRIGILMDKTDEYLDEVAGEGENFPVIQYEELLDEPVQPFAPASESVQEHKLLEALKNFWPAKYLNAGQGAFKQLILQGSQAAKTFGCSNRTSIEFFILLQYVFGHRFYEDPAYTGLLNILLNKEMGSEYDKYIQLYNKVKERVAGFVEMGSSNEA